MNVLRMSQGACIGDIFPKLVLLILQCVSEFPRGSCKNANSDLVGLEWAWALALLSISGWDLCGWDFSRLWVGLRPGARWPPYGAPQGELPLPFWGGVSLRPDHRTEPASSPPLLPPPLSVSCLLLPLPPHVVHATFCLHSRSWLGSTTSHDSSLTQFQRTA